MIKLNEHGLKAARFPEESFSWWDCSIDRESWFPPPFRTIRLFLAPCLFVIKHRHLSGTCLVHFIGSVAGCVFNVYGRFKWLSRPLKERQFGGTGGSKMEDKETQPEPHVQTSFCTVCGCDSAQGPLIQSDLRVEEVSVAAVATVLEWFLWHWSSGE